MNYSQLPTSYKYDTIAGAIYAREVEYFHYQFDLINYQHIISATPPCDERSRLVKMVSEIEENMHRVERVVSALQAQIDDPAAYAAAVQRAIEKRREAQ